MQKRQAMQTIFLSQTLTYEEEQLKDAKIYTISDHDAILGYCVEIASAGFGGEVSLMIGYDETGAILGVQVVAHSETPGLGAKIEEKSHLSQYNGKSGAFAVKKDGGEIDAISGATISSRAVANGVTQATAIVNDYIVRGGTSQ